MQNQSLDVSNLVVDATAALEAAGFRVAPELVRRYMAALFTKPFVVLSGLTGSGKTKLAQLIAQWLESPRLEPTNTFQVGDEIGIGKGIYIITKVTSSAIDLKDIRGKTEVVG